MSVVIPVVLAIGLGTLEFGNLFYRYHLMANGVRDAARFAAGVTGDVCSDTALQAKVAAIAAQTGQVNSTDNLAWTSGATIAVSCSTAFDNKSGTYRGGLTIRSVKVTGTVPYAALGFLGFFGLASPTLTVSHQERVIGVR
jgi:Flp pilus assembly protein TadG